MILVRIYLLQRSPNMESFDWATLKESSESDDTRKNWRYQRPLASTQTHSIRGMAKGFQWEEEREKSKRRLSMQKVAWDIKGRVHKYLSLLSTSANNWSASHQLRKKFYHTLTRLLIRLYSYKNSMFFTQAVEPLFVKLKALHIHA